MQRHTSVETAVQAAIPDVRPLLISRQVEVNRVAPHPPLLPHPRQFDPLHVGHAAAHHHDLTADAVPGRRLVALDGD